MAFLDNLDNLDAAAPPKAPGAESVPNDTPSARPSTDSAKPPAAEATTQQQPDDEAASALAFLEAQINQKRAPLSKPISGSPRTGSPALSNAGTATSSKPAVAGQSQPAASAAADEPVSSGWGVSSFWSSATSALQSAQRAADEQYKKVRAEGVAGVQHQLDNLNVAGVDLAKLRKDAEERLGGIVKGVGAVDLDKLRHDLVNQANSTFTQFINTVAPPISAHETIELWLSHPMVGYEGVEGVVYRAWASILEQTESGELVIVWSAPDRELPSERTLNPLNGWSEGWAVAQAETKALRAREEAKPRGRAGSSGGLYFISTLTPADVPVTTVPVFLHLQPVLAPLLIAEPQLMLSGSPPSTPPNHLYFIITLVDPQHDLQFTTVSQPSPGDWLDVDYDKSDWVEERLVEVLRTGVEIVAQDVSALKPSDSSTCPHGWPSSPQRQCLCPRRRPRPRRTPLQLRLNLSRQLQSRELQSREQ